MRYVVVGAGAVGATIGARLAEAGRDVVLVARGPHADAMAADGLRFATPEGERTLRLPVARTPDDVSLTGGDVLVLAVKTDDTAAAVATWTAARVADGSRLPVVCAQNGVESERIALRHADVVVGMCVWLPAQQLEPGVVVAPGTPVTGVLTVGRYPDGTDDLTRALAADLEAARFRAPVEPDVMRWKHAKLLSNLANAVDALVDEDADPAGAAELVDRARAEGEAALRAAGIDVVGPAEEGVRRAWLSVGAVEGHRRVGGSTYQSLARGTGRAESDYLNGEIARIGRSVGVPTPVNVALQRAMAEAARTGERPRTRSAADLLPG